MPELKMKCPFCDSEMLEGYLRVVVMTKDSLATGLEPIFMCVKDGPLFIREEGREHCPYRGVQLSEEEIHQIIVALIDAEQE